MPDQIHFCPLCNAPAHKLLPYNETTFMCRDCDSFFSFAKFKPVCPKCESVKIEDSDFPSPDGNIILQCKSCKKMFSAQELMEYNKELLDKYVIKGEKK